MNLTLNGVNGDPLIDAKEENGQWFWTRYENSSVNTGVQSLILEIANFIANLAQPHLHYGLHLSNGKDRRGYYIGPSGYTFNGPTLIHVADLLHMFIRTGNFEPAAKADQPATPTAADLGISQETYDGYVAVSPKPAAAEEN